MHISRAGIHIALKGAHIPAGEDGAWNGERGQIYFVRGSFLQATHLPPTQSFPGPKHTFPLCKVVLIAQLASAAYPSAADIPLESGLGKGCKIWNCSRNSTPPSPLFEFSILQKGAHFWEPTIENILSVCLSGH